MWNPWTQTHAKSKMATESWTSLPNIFLFGLVFIISSSSISDLEREERRESETIGSLGSPEEYTKKVKNPKTKSSENGKFGPSTSSKEIASFSTARDPQSCQKSESLNTHISLHLSLNPRRKRNIIIALVFYFFVGFGDLGCFQLIFLSMKLPIS